MRLRDPVWKEWFPADKANRSPGNRNPSPPNSLVGFGSGCGRAVRSSGSRQEEAVADRKAVAAGYRDCFAVAPTRERRNNGHEAIFRVGILARASHFAAQRGMARGRAAAAAGSARAQVACPRAESAVRLRIRQPEGLGIENPNLRGSIAKTRGMRACRARRKINGYGTRPVAANGGARRYPSSPIGSARRLPLRRSRMPVALNRSESIARPPGSGHQSGARRRRWSLASG